VAVALLIPRTETGRFDPEAYETQLRFLQRRGIECFALNGATGEYILTTPDEFRCLLQLTRRVIGPSARLVAGVGAAGAHNSRELAEIAQQEAADGILLPMPYFFPYGQDDLSQYVEAVADSLTLPIYLYNLPTFTSALNPSTTLELIARSTNIVGIKDSSGSLETLSLLRREAPQAACILGYDGTLHAAVADRVCDGLVSGVACVLPELMLRIYSEASIDPSSGESARLKRVLDEFLSWLHRFPVPWGLKIIAEARELGSAYFPMPLSREKQAARQEFLDWFKANRAMLCADRDGCAG
jgi:4-hydroxy-tetrahydrodipicolinate synthase